MAPTETVLAEGSNFLVPNATFFAELVAFLIILGILWKYVLPPVTKALDERQEIIRTQMEEAEATKVKLAATEADYRKKMQEASTMAAQIRDEARADAAADPRRNPRQGSRGVRPDHRGRSEPAGGRAHGDRAPAP